MKMKPILRVHRIAKNYATLGIQMQAHFSGALALHFMLWKWGLIVGVWWNKNVLLTCGAEDVT